MAFPGAERLLDFSQEFDVGMLDTVVGAFYTPGGDPVTVRPNPRARRPRRRRGLVPRSLALLAIVYPPRFLAQISLALTPSPPFRP